MAWWSWFRKALERPDLEVVFYTRAGCHLCEDAWTELERWRARHAFRVTVRDIDTDAVLVERFGTCVPVIEVNGKVRLRGRFNAVLFRRLLDAPRDKTIDPDPV
jgi:hypothetical protein